MRGNKEEMEALKAIGEPILLRALTEEHIGRILAVPDVFDNRNLFCYLIRRTRTKDLDIEATIFKPGWLLLIIDVRVSKDKSLVIEFLHDEKQYKCYESLIDPSFQSNESYLLLPSSSSF